MDLVSDIEEGGIYEGTVIEIKDFGAVVELLRNKEGLLHVSEIIDSSDRHRGGNIGLVREHLKVGDKIEVLCTKIDHVQGSIKLSRKKLIRMRENTRSPLRPNNVESFEPFLNQGVNLPISSGASEDHVFDKEDETIRNLDIHSNVGGSVSKTHATLIDDGSLGNTFEKDDAGDELEDTDQYISNTGDKPDEEGSERGGTGDHTRYTADELDNEESGSGSLNTLAKPTPLEARWMERYYELREYYVAHGHCNVPRSSLEHPKLGGWVHSQRKQYKKDSIANNRVQLLNDVGFVWSFEDQNKITWELNYNELKEYRSANDHCNVPAASLEHPTLANWVKYQRAKYRNGCLSDDRVELLNDVGFEWSR
eukprot:CAMPEP_0201680288 /NCGR_PEP_ID=MMETSP0494-20130426/50468_1 /ASSEMBLY_ACC=CAM_ASM_000839 /TAXON_ID=420259 /ORGANISM="Thalassiosira gravida, Strain GMp14c1" /LENGTH=365 /DNA_ID=CAMNT_0048164001 /DNA_START=59 /DNA_END=1156 /DNA_ORIENTATION=-